MPATADIAEPLQVHVAVLAIGFALEHLARLEAAKPVPRAAYFEALQDAVAEVKNVLHRTHQQQKEPA